MSDLNELIHTNATIAFNQGAQREQERIIKDLVLEIETAKELNETDCYLSGMEHALLLIKGEKK
jgi:hypothetical protein